MQYGETALIHAALRGKTDCLSALIQAKANLDIEDIVRCSGDVVWVPGCNTDYLVFESALGQTPLLRDQSYGLGCVGVECSTCRSYGAGRRVSVVLCRVWGLGCGV